MSSAPNILFIMTDQQRIDTIRSLGNSHIYTPNLDRLVARGLAFTRGYTTCPVCVPARYTIRTGCEPPRIGLYTNGRPSPAEGQAETVEERCGPYLPRTLRSLGYRTFGVGKFHTVPWDEDLGYHVHLHSEEMYGSQDQRQRDAYAAWIAREHPEYQWIEGLMGERTEMYYMPQMSAMPKECCVEAWAADRTVEQLGVSDDRPYFGFVSFIGPHPPCAPPLPFNRMYDPDRLPSPVVGERDVDHMDEHLPWMNYRIWADDVSDLQARTLKARYYGEISFIDSCIGRILEAVEEREDADNTLICFFADHGDHLGDHHAWQKESFFEPSCHIPFLLSWPSVLPAGERRDELVCLTDLFGIATRAAGTPQQRDGIDVLGMLSGEAPQRERVVGCHGEPGTARFKIMVRRDCWKYIFFANGGRCQLFNLERDPEERCNLAECSREVAEALHREAIDVCRQANAERALEGDDLRTFPFEERPYSRIHQFDSSRGVTGFPENPEDVLQGA